ncbi:MAG: hypothetical protein [Circular genetic element sp.]|nr:MAG: hypothetical protein [Circular genetic element sp.]
MGIGVRLFSSRLHFQPTSNGSSRTPRSRVRPAVPTATALGSPLFLNGHLDHGVGWHVHQGRSFPFVIYHQLPDGSQGCKAYAELLEHLQPAVAERGVNAAVGRLLGLFRGEAIRPASVLPPCLRRGEAADHSYLGGHAV